MGTKPRNAGGISCETSFHMSLAIARLPELDPARLKRGAATSRLESEAVGYRVYLTRKISRGVEHFYAAIR
jgi:hypothetical protein